MLPVEDIRAAAVEALERDPGSALSYAVGGHRGLRDWIGRRHAVDPSRVLLVNGSLQGVTFLAQHCFADRSGAALVEDPTYDRTLIALRTQGAEVRSVPVTDDGVDVNALARALAEGPPPRLIYLIPTFQNPSGVSLNAAGRRRVVELARDHGVLVVEDDPYGLLRFEGDAAPTLHSIDGGDNVVYSSSFTKTVAPGLRTGYLVLPERLVEPLGRLSENTVIGPNTFAEATLAAYCEAGRFEPNVARATGMLKARRDAMEVSLSEHFPEGSHWTTPEGGYFYWVDLPDHLEARELLGEATERGVPYIEGAAFCTAPGRGRSSLRLAFSAVSPEQIHEGIARLGEVFSRSTATA